MQFISCHNGKLLTLAQQRYESADHSFHLGVEGIDNLLPDGLSRGAIHEVLVLPSQRPARFFALLIARAAAGRNGVGRNGAASDGVIVWCDASPVYPPAVAAVGIAPRQLLLVRPKSPHEEHWALAECLRCKGVRATIAAPRRLSHVEARRLQLAAEVGGGIGVLMRPWNSAASIYAAATRWLVEPAAGERTIQRWKVRCIHGHGGRGRHTLSTGHALLNCDVYLEYCRESHQVRSRNVREVEELAAGSFAAAI